MRSLLKYVDHLSACDWLQPMWQEPCDCGLHYQMSLLADEELAQLEAEAPELVRSYRGAPPKPSDERSS